MRTLALVMAAATLLAAACGDAKGPNEVQSIAGTYQLQTVDGHALPVVEPGENPGEELALLSGSLTLNQSGTFSATETYRITDSTGSLEMSLTATGSYTTSGSTVTFSALQGSELPISFSGTVSGNTLMVSIEGSILVYRR